MSILTLIMADPGVSPDLKRVLGNPAAACRAAHIERYRAMIDSRPAMSAEEAEREQRERPGLYEASDARYDWKDAT